MIASRLGDSAPYRGGRRKRHYKVTPVGLRNLRASLNSLRRLAAGLAVGLETLS